jgi:hypothetical protein
MIRPFIVTVALLAISASAHAQEAMPLSRTWNVFGAKLSVTVWEVDSVRASRSIARAHTTVLRADSLLFPDAADVRASTALTQAYAIDLAVNALLAEDMTRGSVELAGNARYFGKPPEGDVSLPRFNGHVVNVCYAASCKCRSYSAGLT